MTWLRYGAMITRKIRAGPWPRSVIKTWCMTENCIILQNDSRLGKSFVFLKSIFQKRISCCCTSSSWNDGNDLNIFPLTLIKVWDFGQGMSFQKTRLIVSSLFHLQIKLTSSASDPEQRQSFQRRKVRNVEQWSLSVSTILELEGREREGGQMLTSSSKYSKKCKFR